MKNYYEIIKESELLAKTFEFIIKYSTSLYLPYHNLNHNLIVLQYCYANLQYETLLNTNDADCLLLSAIFHDYNHSGGKLKDNENIANAYIGLAQFVNANNFDIDLALCEKYLNVTQFPYITEPEDIYEKIIRDSDLCQMFESGYLQSVVFGLKQEMNITEMDKMLAMQLKFVSNINFNTKYCTNLYDKRIEDIIEQLEFLNNLYK